MNDRVWFSKTVPPFPGPADAVYLGPEAGYPGQPYDNWGYRNPALTRRMLLWEQSAPALLMPPAQPIDWRLWWPQPHFVPSAPVARAESRLAIHPPRPNPQLAYQDCAPFATW